MKKILLILILTLSISSFAQKDKRHERIKTLKIAFITERLQLTETEAQKFWPIYNAYEEEEKYGIRMSFGNRTIESLESISDDEAEKLLESMITKEKKRHQIRTKFINDLKKILPVKKIILLEATEDAFRKHLMKQYKKRREGVRRNHP